MRTTGWLTAFVFVGAALVFTLEPLAGRLLLPAFGSAFHVWSTALMFFQGALFAGYLYAHLLAPRLGRLHLLVLLAPLPLLPFVAPAVAGPPSVLALLAALALTFGLPMVVLSSTSVVAQRWLAADPSAEPYRLYAASNAGSLLALVLYVAVLEPALGLDAQAWLFAGGYGLYVVLGGVALHRATPIADAASVGPRPPLGRLAYWTLLAAAPSALSLAVTNVFVLDVGNVPLVWVAPLAVYLLTFVLAFGRAAFHPAWLRRFFPHVAVVGVVAFSLAGGVEGASVLLHLAVLFLVAAAAHGELHAARPAPASLTWFYLALALGGWLGAALVALAAPACFDGVWEYPLALFAVVGVVAVGRRARVASGGPGPAWASLAVVAVVGLAAILARAPEADVVEARRGPYGVHRVVRLRDGGVRSLGLLSGRTVHGRQRFADDGATLLREPLGYYHREGPLGAVLAALPSPRRVGVVGLGVGALAGHLEAGDHVTFHELDPRVVDLARRRFTFLDGPAHVEVVLGDARRTLDDADRAGAPPYDLLFLDAFAGDAVPLHLLTAEALALYRRRVRPDGLVLFHVSNRYLRLEPVVLGAARHLGLAARGARRARDLALLEDASSYVAVGTEAALAPLAGAGFAGIPGSGHLLTDDRASALPLWRGFE